MPGKHTELKTKVIKKELNPVYNDEFSFVVCNAVLKQRVLHYKLKDIGERMISSVAACQANYFTVLQLSPTDVQKKTVVFQVRLYT